MYWKDDRLSRESARAIGLVVFEANSQDFSVVLEESEDVIIELRSLFPFEDFEERYGIVATRKTTGEHLVLLEASSKKDLNGTYYTFSSESVLIEAIKNGVKWLRDRSKEEPRDALFNNAEAVNEKEQTDVSFQYSRIMRENAYSLLKALEKYNKLSTSPEPGQEEVEAQQKTEFKLFKDEAKERRKTRRFNLFGGS